MAGRGTDIVLGGNLEAELDSLQDKTDEATIEKIKRDWQVRHDAVLQAGGLHVLGTERNEARRIDNQLRGRAGRQGDPGSSQFYLALDDNLMRIFASERVAVLMKKLGMQDNEVIAHSLVSRAVENAQRKVEQHNVDIRKQLLKYDDVANDQRKVVYDQRDEYMHEEHVNETIADMREDVISGVVDAHIPPESIEEMWDLPGLQSQLELMTGESFDVAAWLDKEPDIAVDAIKERIITKLEDNYNEKEELAGVEPLRQFEKAIVLQKLDEHWKEHLAGMDYLRQSVGLRGYAQKNPKQEYKREAYELFMRMLDEYKTDVVTLMNRVQVQDPAEVEAARERQARQQQQIDSLEYEHASATSALDESAQQPSAEAEPGPAGSGGQAPALRQTQGGGAEAEEKNEQPYVRDGRKVGRNEPCPCGSGKKFKQCHGKL